MFDIVEKALEASYRFEDKDETRKFFADLRQQFIDWNDKRFDSPEFESGRAALAAKIEESANVQ